MTEPELQLDPRLDDADIRAPLELDDPARSFPSLPRTRRFVPRDQTGEIPEGRLRGSICRRDAIYRRALAVADLASAAIAVLIGVPILGNDGLNPIALLALPLVLVVGKLTGLYDRDEHLIRKTTLDEVPTLFWVATLYALLIFLAGDLIVDGGFGRDQAVGVWALLFASMVTIRALARNVARKLSGEERCLILGDAETAEWIMRRFREAPGLKARVIGRAPLASVFGRNGSGANGSNGHNGHNGGPRDRRPGAPAHRGTDRARDHLAARGDLR